MTDLEWCGKCGEFAAGQVRGRMWLCGGCAPPVAAQRPEREKRGIDVEAARARAAEAAWPTTGPGRSGGPV